MLVQLKLAGPSPPPPPAPPARWAEEGMAQLISTAPTFACKTVPYGNDIYDFGDYTLSHGLYIFQESYCKQIVYFYYLPIFDSTANICVAICISREVITELSRILKIK